MCISSWGTPENNKDSASPNDTNFYIHAASLIGMGEYRNLIIFTVLAGFSSTITFSLNGYFAIYLFGLDASGIAIVSTMMLPGALIATPAVNRMSRYFDKPKLVQISSIFVLLLGVSVLVLRLSFLSIFTDRSVSIVLVSVHVGLVAFAFSFQGILVGSLTADFVNVYQMRSRNIHKYPATVFALHATFGKLINGLGLMTSGMIVYFGTDNGSKVDELSIETIAIYFVVCVFAINSFTSYFAYSSQFIERAEYEKSQSGINDLERMDQPN